MSVMAEKFARSEHPRKRIVRYQRDDIRSVSSHDANMSGNNAFGENLRAARKALGWSMETLAEKADTSKGYISDLEKGLAAGGRPMPPGRTVQKFADALGTTVEALTASVETAYRPQVVPLVGYVGAGGEAFYAATDENLGEVDAPEGSTSETVAAEIRGESLGPIFDRWLVFYDEVRRPVTDDLIGKLCVVGLPNDKVLVKKLRKASGADLYHLESNTEATLYDQEILWAAKVKTMTPR